MSEWDGGQFKIVRRSPYRVDASYVRGDRLIGWAQVVTSQDRWFIDYIEVDVDQRRRGLGEWMIRRIAETAAPTPLTVLSVHDHAVGFWEKMRERQAIAPDSQWLVIGSAEEEA